MGGWHFGLFGRGGGGEGSRWRSLHLLCFIGLVLWLLGMGASIGQGSVYIYWVIMMTSGHDFSQA